jgi:dockerin type I repeat protein
LRRYGPDDQDPSDDNFFYDQRGEPFTRVFDGDGAVVAPDPPDRIDIGAVEYGVGAPRVVDIVFSSTISEHDPFSFAAAVFDDPSTPVVENEQVTGSGNQLRTVPVGYADTISIIFNEQVNVSEEHLSVRGLTTAAIPTVATFTSFDPATMIASWTFTSFNIADNYLISLVDAVSDVDNELLDGDWTNPASINTVNSDVSVFASGNGTAGGNFNFVATLLPGDASLDGIVDGVDVGILLSFLNIPIGDARFEQGDFDGDGWIDTADAGLLIENYSMNLQNIIILADVNHDMAVDDLDAAILIANFNMGNPTYEDGDIDGNGFVDGADAGILIAQFGIEIELAF